jgi:cyclic beta-1,2-glucan synthetase
VFLLANEAIRVGALDEERLVAFLGSRGKSFSSVTLSLLPDVLFTAAFKNISRLLIEGDAEDICDAISAAEKLQFIDFTRVFLTFSASAQIFSVENAGVFKNCDEKTKIKYIAALIDKCNKEGREECELAEELLARANSRGAHIGELLFEKKKYVGRVYAVCLALTVALICIIYFLLCGRGALAIITLPAAALSCYGMSKELLSLCFKHAGGDGLLRMNAATAQKERAVIAIMSIITGAEGDGELFERLENFYLSEECENRFYAVVCNLPDSKKKARADDEKIISSAIKRIEALNAKYGEHFGIFVRERRYSRSEGKYIGWERKRGAVLELCRFMRGEKTSIYRYIADKCFLEKAKYLITLDSDTNLYSGASCELVGTMMHPLNKPIVRDGAVVSGHAVVQPHIAPTLESSSAILLKHSIMRLKASSDPSLPKGLTLTEKSP